MRREDFESFFVAFPCGSTAPWQLTRCSAMTVIMRAFSRHWCLFLPFLVKNDILKRRSNRKKIALSAIKRSILMSLVQLSVIVLTTKEDGICHLLPGNRSKRRRTGSIIRHTTHYIGWAWISLQVDQLIKYECRVHFPPLTVIHGNRITNRSSTQHNRLSYAKPRELRVEMMLNVEFFEACEVIKTKTM